MSYINVSSIRKKAMAAKKTINQSDAIVEKRLEKGKQEFLNSFEQHPITQELSEGVSANNLSRTLGGKGNLFSFIGFNEGDDPIENLRQFLSEGFDAKRRRVSNEKIIYRIKYPSLEKIKNITKMPWESGKSWVEGIEKGISGLSNYLFKKSQASRSGAAIQTKYEINSSIFKPMKYMTSIINKFKNNFK